MARIVWDDAEPMHSTPGRLLARTPALPGRVGTASRQIRLTTLCARVVATLALWRARGRQRDLLSQLDSRMLRDIGLTRDDARRECAKPFWR
jgi:uncharacterized protein YjiS (DUF1127 family)